MFLKNLDDRLSTWMELRKSLEHVDNPLNVVSEFWSTAPMIIHNHKVDPYNPKSWPTPWELIEANKYDDFTIALMMAYSLKLSDKFKNDKVEVKTMVDSAKTRLYNVVYVNDDTVLNYSQQPVPAQEVDETLYVENIIEVVYPR